MFVFNCYKKDISLKTQVEGLETGRVPSSAASLQVLCPATVVRRQVRKTTSIPSNVTSVNNCLNNRFCLADGSVLAAHKLVLAITSSVFKGMFFGPLADENLSQVNFMKMMSTTWPPLL